MTEEAKEFTGVSEIISSMVEEASKTNYPMTMSEAQRAYNAFKEAICTELKKGKTIQLQGFLSFVPTYKSPRQFFNIATQASQQSRESVVLNVKASPKLKKIVSNYDEDLIKYYKGKKDN